jgi:hypothetical protein
VLAENIRRTSGEEDGEPSNFTAPRLSACRCSPEVGAAKNNKATHDDGSRGNLFFQMCGQPERTSVKSKGTVFGIGAGGGGDSGVDARIVFAPISSSSGS